MRLLPFEFNQIIQEQRIVTKFVKSELKFKPKMSQKRYDKIFKSYLKNLESKQKIRAVYSGKYLLMCSDCLDPADTNGRYHFESVRHVLHCDAIFDLHVDHNFVLLHESVVKKMSIRKLAMVKEVMAN